MSGAPERPQVVALARRSEGLAWLELGLWAPLATGLRGMVGSELPPARLEP
jgi:hypothetical protein